MDESGAWEEPAALEEEPGALAAESGPRSDVDESPVEPASPWHADARNALDDLAAEFGGEEIEDLLEDEQEQTQEPVEVDAGAATGQDLGLVTETMAELYRSQGFHERAAEVYRALLRQRPYDLRLSAKLSETEADVAAAAAEKAAAAAAAAPEDEAAGEVWLRGVGSSWDAGEPAESAPESPYAWTPEPEDQSGGTSIGSYLRDLVSWKTATQRWAATPPPPPPPASPSPSWSSAGDPWGSEGQTDEPWGMTEDAAALDPWGSPAPTGENVLGSPPEAASAGAPGQAVEASGSGDPWTSSPTEPVSPVETGRESEPADPWLLGITDTPADPWGGATEAASGTPWQQESVQDPAKGEPEAAPAPAADAGSQGEQGEQDREDEDLEMFRSWLQSLKK